MLSRTTEWVGTLGYTVGSGLSHHYGTIPTPTPLTNINTWNLREWLLSRDLSWATTSGQLPKSCHTHIHSSERRGISLLTTPASTEPKSSSLPLFLPLCPSVCVALKSLDRTVHCTHTGASADTYCGVWIAAFQIYTRQQWHLVDCSNKMISYKVITLLRLSIASTKSQSKNKFTVNLMHLSNTFAVPDENYWMN